MKCCTCDRELDTTVCVIPPAWFGLYLGATLIKVICKDCIRDPEKKASYRDSGEVITRPVNGK